MRWVNLSYIISLYNLHVIFINIDNMINDDGDDHYDVGGSDDDHAYECCYSFINYIYFYFYQESFMFRMYKW